MSVRTFVCFFCRAIVVLVAAGICTYSADAGKRASQKQNKKSSATAVRVETATTLHILQEPDDRSVRSLYSPTVSTQGDTLYGVNFANGSLEKWDLRTGALLAPFSFPDNYRHFYRTDPAEDTVWLALEKDGFNPARFISVCAVGGELYAMATLPASYSVVEATGTDNEGNARTMLWPQWQWRQVVVRIAGDSVADIFPLPADYVFTGLYTDGKGLIGGTCRTPGNFADPSEVADSAVVLALCKGAAGADAKTVALWKLPISDMSGLTALTGIAANGTLWYCNPEKRKFFMRKNNGTIQKVEPRGSLRDCAGFTGGYGIPVPDFGGKMKPFRLRSIVPSGNGVALLLIPSDPQAGAAPVIQTYDASGKFCSEHVLDIASLRNSTATWLLMSQGGEAHILIETSEQRWRVEKVPLAVQ